MAYIWINPVTAKMYEPEVLNEFLRLHSYKRFEISGDWLTIVKEKYRLAVQQETRPVMDVRCPKIRDLLREEGIASEVVIPEINPILIHCGQEAARRLDLQDEQKIITTPCQALADMGNALGLKDTWFVPWNRFLATVGKQLPVVPLESSPIPPGFFDELNLKTVSITGEEEIRTYLKNGISEGVQLVEMLFCKEGCHNGDGIRGCEI